jgi:hypothetical protein
MLWVDLSSQQVPSTKLHIFFNPNILKQQGDQRMQILRILFCSSRYFANSNGRQV